MIYVKYHNKMNFFGLILPNILKNFIYQNFIPISNFITLLCQGTTAAETLQWLQGITISTGESPTVITSAIESGQTITLTGISSLHKILTF